MYYVTISCILIIACGFILFYHTVPQQSSSLIDQEFDAIIVLTGGKSRIHLANEIFKLHHEKYFFISGTNPKTTIQQIITHYNIPESQQHNLIISSLSTSTAGNAIESKLLLQSIKATKVLLVTANYHMPRSLWHFQQHLPDIEFFPHPSFSDNVEDSTGKGWYILYVEYLKMLRDIAIYYIYGTKHLTECHILSNIKNHGNILANCMKEINNSNRYCNIIHHNLYHSHPCY